MKTANHRCSLRGDGNIKRSRSGTKAAVAAVVSLLLLLLALLSTSSSTVVE